MIEIQKLKLLTIRYELYISEIILGNIDNFEIVSKKMFKVY